jgi:hypothetical protein
VGAAYAESADPASLLRNVLDTLIMAIWPPKTPAPTTTQILRSTVNDVIVTGRSQTDNGIADFYLMPINLAHTRVPYSATIQKYLGTAAGVDVSVENSSAVNQLIACWLATSGDTNCPSATTNDRIPEMELAEATSQWSVKSLTPDRLVIGTPHQTPRLRVPFELPLRISKTEPLDITISDEHNSPASGTATIRHWLGQTAYMTITPWEIGPIEFMILARFADGGAAAKNITVDVQPPAAPPESFTIYRGISEMTVSLNSPDEANEPIAILRPEATYSGIEGKLDLDPSPGCNFVSYTVIPGQDDPGITVQPNGFLRAVRPGEATVEAHFGPAVDRVHFIIEPYVKGE